MAKVYNLDLEKSEFDAFNSNGYLITENANDYQATDYLLLNEYENIQTEESSPIEHPTGLYAMTQISQVITDAGLKENHVLLILRKVN